MAGILDSVNQLTELVGQNRLELLLFSLPGRSQRFGINVFKVREVLQCPRLTVMPKIHRYVRGVAHIRGQTISVIDLSMAIGGRAVDNLDNSFVIIAEYNRSVQGFLVEGVEKIINMDWSKILPPPQGMGKINYLTAVTQVDEKLVEILDVEKILDEISPVLTDVNDDIVHEVQADIEQKLQESGQENIKRKVMVADDSSVARKQVERALKTLGLEAVLVTNGQEAFDILKEMSKEGSIYDQIGLLISDIEMPEMDGYTLTAKLRNEPKLNKLKIILHTSLSGVFNQAMVKKVGADNFIAKFNPDDLAKAVKELMQV
ncbi:MAG: chemotaxis protein [Ruminobacter sp.]|nr:chemotaxis protein [Ruminobacter sp.]